MLACVLALVLAKDCDSQALSGRKEIMREDLDV
jgi:hypothetical protein